MRLLPLVTAALTAAAGLTAAAAGSSAVTPADLYVTVSGSDTSTDCMSATPCASVQHAVDVAAGAATVHVGPGTFTGTASISQGDDITIIGDSVTATTLTAPGAAALSADGGRLAVEHLTIDDVMDGVQVSGADTALVMRDVVVHHPTSIGIVGSVGTADISDVLVDGAGYGQPGAFAAGLFAVKGTWTIDHTSVLDTGDSSGSGAGMVLQGNETITDSTVSGSSADGIEIESGSAVIKRSLVSGTGQTGVVDTGGPVGLEDSTVTTASGLAVYGSENFAVLRSTIVATGSATAVGGSPTVAGSIVSADTPPACVNTPVDGGFDVATDSSCSFTDNSDAQGLGSLGLGPLADHGGATRTLTGSTFSPMTNAIPRGATVLNTTDPLCPSSGAIDQRGAPRPQGNDCDAGAVELAPTTTTLTASRYSAPKGASVTLRAAVTAQSIGVTDPHAPSGRVSFDVGDPRCQNLVLMNGAAQCTTTRLITGRRLVTAEFVSSNEYLYSRGFHAFRIGSVPTFVPSGPIGWTIGHYRQVRLATSDSPGLSVRALTPLPRGLRIVGSLLQWAPRPGTAGRHVVRFRATNDLGSTTRRVAIEIRRQATVVRIEGPSSGMWTVGTASTVYMRVTAARIGGSSVRLPDPTGSLVITTGGHRVADPGCRSRLDAYGEVLCTMTFRSAGQHRITVRFPGDAAYRPARSSITIDVRKSG